MVYIVTSCHDEKSEQISRWLSPRLPVSLPPQPWPSASSQAKISSSVLNSSAHHHSSMRRGGPVIAARPAAERFCVPAVMTAAAQLPAWLPKLEALVGETKLENHMRRNEPMKEITPTEQRPSFTENERGSMHRDLRLGVSGWLRCL
jgi:hypothetical protein